MQISSRFTIAIHILLCIDIFGDEDKVTSEYLAGSININPVIVRKILLQLQSANIVETRRGVGGSKLTRSLEEITFYDIYMAVESVEKGKLFSFHEKPNKDCSVGGNIHSVLDKRLNFLQSSLESEMKKIKLSSLSDEIRELTTKKQ